jgi:hypothetical protein
MFFAATVAQDPLTTAAIISLLAALGLSSTSGLRAYLPLFAVGLAGSIPGPLDGKLIPLQPNFSGLSSPAMLLLLGLLVVGEFTVDKLPVVDHVSDLVHTVLRPVAGAVIMAGTANSLSDKSQWAAAAVGAVLAFAFHGVKATARPAVTATTAGIGNPIVSFIEDVLVVLSVVLLIFAPVIGVVLLAALVLFIGRFLLRATRRFRAKRAGTLISSADQQASGKRGGRRSRKRGAGGAAAVAVAPVPVPVGVPAAAPQTAQAGAAAALPAAGAPGVAAGPSTPFAPAAPVTPTVPTTPDAPTVAATNPPPFAPSPAQSPYVPPLPAPGMPPTPTQPYPQAWPGQPQQQQPGAPYPDDATTLPGSY